MNTQPIDFTDDVLDVRDIIDRLDEIRDDPDYAEEQQQLEVVLNDLRGKGGDHEYQGDWYPVTLIHEYYFTRYARELAEELYGRELGQAVWPFTQIDWECAAEELRVDYSSLDIDVDGVAHTYYYR